MRRALLNFDELPISNPVTVNLTMWGPVMRRLLAVTIAATTLTLAVSFSAPVFAADAADPTVHQIYEAAEAGHFDQAQQMMDQVLRDHPTSSKAHYVQAELYAKEGKTALARAQLAQAEEIDPGLTHENPRSVQALKAQLGMLPRTTQGARVIGMTGAPAAAAAPHFPWGTVLVLVAVVGVLWMLFRRRNPYAQYPAGASPVGGAPGGYAGPSGYGGGYGGPVGGGGVGSGIAGGLASGLAVGAGAVAGAELAHHFLDGDRREGTVLPPAADNSDWQQPSNSDMGGSDFGVNDAGSWDDSSGGGGGGDGGGDWS
jgi:uncharacterized protein